MYLGRGSMPYFSRFLCYILTFGSSGLNCEFIRREYGFFINLKIPFMSLGYQPILTFADFDILQILMLNIYF